MKLFLISGVAAIFSLVSTIAAAHVVGYEVVARETAVDASPTKQLIVNCPTDKKAMGGGWAVLDPTSAILEGQATTSQPAFDGSHWLVNARNLSAFAPAWKLKVWAICASARTR